jgi:hypothetical protein
MTGAITFHAVVTIPSGRRPFLQRVRLSKLTGAYDHPSYGIEK